jgi:hypothetical protein
VEVVAARAANAMTHAIQQATIDAQVQLRKTLTAQIVQLKEQEARLDKKMGGHLEQVRLFEEAKQLSHDRDWMAQTGKGKRVCTVCTTHHASFTHPKQLISPWLAANGGQPVNSVFRAALRDHEESLMHKEALKLETMRKQNPVAAMLLKQQRTDVEITARLMRTAVQGVKQYRSFNDYEHIVYLQHENGTDVGDRHHGRHTAAAMLELIYNDEAAQTRAFMSARNAMTGARPSVGMAADKVCDKVFDQWEVVNARVNYLGAPVTFLADLREMTEDATGLSCWKEIRAAEEHCGIIPGQSQSFCFDGEAAYQGHLSGVAAHIANERPRADVGHDYPHAGALCYWTTPLPCCCATLLCYPAAMIPCCCDTLLL